MGDLLQNVEFWKVTPSLLWPIVVLIIFFCVRRKVYEFIKRDNLTIKVAGMEISVANATKGIGVDVADLQKRMADIEEGINGKTKSVKSIDFEDDIFSILWVDDYPSNNAFLVESFQKDGIDVKLALNTDQAIKYMSSGNFDMIITDLGRNEGGVDNAFAGIDLAREVRAQDSEMPILVFAGSRGLENRKKLLSVGVSDVTQSAVEVQRFVYSLRARRKVK